MPETINAALEYGAVLHNGSVDWGVQAWFGELDTPEKRADFQKNYNTRLAAVGVDPFEVSFVSRTRAVTLTDPVAVTD